MSSQSKDALSARLFTKGYDDRGDASTNAPRRNGRCYGQPTLYGAGRFRRLVSIGALPARQISRESLPRYQSFSTGRFHGRFVHFVSPRPVAIRHERSRPRSTWVLMRQKTAVRNSASGATGQLHSLRVRSRYQSRLDLKPPVKTALDGVVVTAFGELTAPRDAERGVIIEGEIKMPRAPAKANSPSSWTKIAPPMPAPPPPN